eukprot:TRINITY_DN58195_c0_g1_i1.p1 TRINITY_DN58195_c0_g1~~TRINITY_DN58195_c0_g1_i1.p1  ORF type:complete len:807 (+),score=261.66 TRINITY_DN58195_c0_g1_i1:203-2623(+)
MYLAYKAGVFACLLHGAAAIRQASSLGFHDAASALPEGAAASRAFLGNHTVASASYLQRDKRPSAAAEGEAVAGRREESPPAAAAEKEGLTIEIDYCDRKASLFSPSCWRSGSLGKEEAIIVALAVFCVLMSVVAAVLAHALYHQDDRAALDVAQGLSGSAENEVKDEESKPEDEKAEAEAVDEEKEGRANVASLERGIASAMAYAVPIVMQGQKLQEALEKRKEMILERAGQMAYEEAHNLASDVSKAFKADGLIEEAMKTHTMLETPTVSVLVASAFAPAQLRFHYSANKTSICLNLFSAAVSLGVLVADQLIKCDVQPGLKEAKIKQYEARIVLWFAVSASLDATSVMTRFLVNYSIGRFLQDLPEPPSLATATDKFDTLRRLVEYYINTGGSALVRLDEVSRSSLNVLADLSVVLQLLWMLYGGDIVMVTPWLPCTAVGVVVLRIRVFLFLVLLIPSSFNLILSVLNMLAFVRQTQTSVLQAAKDLDKGLGLGVPVAGILARAFMVRGSDDIAVELQMNRLEQQRLERDLRAAEATLASVREEKRKADLSVDSLEAKRAQLAAEDSEIALQLELRDQLLQNSKKLIDNLSDVAQHAADAADKQVKEWEEGGGPEVLQKLAAGELDMETLQRNANQTLQSIQEDESFQRALAQGQEVATLAKAKAAELAEDERVQRALEKGKEVAKDIARDERVQRAIEKSKEVANDIAQDERVQRAIEKGKEVATDIAADERVQLALEKGKQVASDIAEQAAQDERVQRTLSTLSRATTSSAQAPSSSTAAPAAPPEDSRGEASGSKPPNAP